MARSILKTFPIVEVTPADSDQMSDSDTSAPSPHNENGNGQELPLWEILPNVLGFPNEDQKYWWRQTAPSLGRLMSKAKYSQQLQHCYLTWLYMNILPALGSRPSDRATSRWTSHLTHNNFPFEPSLNITATKSVVRFQIEPISCLAGDPQDPFNQIMSLELMDRLQKATPELDLSWFDHFAKEFYISGNAAADARIRAPHGQTLPTSFLAFELVDGKVGVRAHFFPSRKAIQTETCPGRLVSQAIKKLDKKEGSLTPSLSLVDELLNGGSAIKSSDVEMVAVDCANPSQARIEIFVRSFDTSFNGVRKIYTLGGRLSDENTQNALSSLKDLWTELFDITDNDRKLPVKTPRSCLVYGFELKAGSPVPAVKVYFPIWQYIGDRKAARALSRFCRQHGLNQTGTSYPNDLHVTFPESYTETSTGTHTYLCFTFTKETGLNITTYYSPTGGHEESLEEFETKTLSIRQGRPESEAQIGRQISPQREEYMKVVLN
ncbi:MAG: hypothetical protein M1820_005032 [Bogoriella megaspora]|nr:MAG: hypothetical protein M1820_005032 [Bogoriella megaspora]